MPEFAEEFNLRGETSKSQLAKDNKLACNVVIKEQLVAGFDTVNNLKNQSQVVLVNTAGDPSLLSLSVNSFQD